MITKVMIICKILAKMLWVCLVFNIYFYVYCI